VDGIVSGVFAGGHFTVALDVGPTVRATISGRMRRYRVRVLFGDRVRVALSKYDLTHGLITYRELNRSRRAA
jgi:translation initiation factor IF-1